MEVENPPLEHDISLKFLEAPPVTLDVPAPRLKPLSKDTVAYDIHLCSTLAVTLLFSQTCGNHVTGMLREIVMDL